MYHSCNKPLTSVTIAAPDGDTDFWGTSASDLQTGVTVSNNNITGTLHYIDSGALARDWGAGNFLALAFSDIGNDITSIKVGLEPSRGSGLVELINDPDKMGVFRIDNKDTQRFKIVLNDTHTLYYNLDGLTCENS